MMNLDTVKERLKEEKWTRDTINSYKINDFKELDEMIDTEFKKEEGAELKTLCTDHLIHSKTSIIALYIAGMLSFKRQDIDDTLFIDLIELFKDNKKWTIVEFLCQQALTYSENNFALRTLSDYYTNIGDNEKKTAVWERIIKIDYDEAEIVKQLAEVKRDANDLPAAIDYYKKALYRFINKKYFNNVKEIWNKLVEFIPEEKEFFFHAEKKINVAFDNEKTNELLEELFRKTKKAENWDLAVEILKRMLAYNPTDRAYRREIIHAFRQKYADNDKVEDYIELSNLNQDWRNVQESIDDFEKHISFAVKTFVFHRTWGTGFIRQMTNDDIVIQFAHDKQQTMSVAMAAKALIALPKSHIWVQKSITPPKVLHDKVQQEVAWTLKTIIQSYDNACSLKQIKKELVPGILTPNEWLSWSNQAKRILKEDDYLANLPDQIDVYEVRETPIDPAEKIFNQFKAEKDFYGKLKAIQEFLDGGFMDSDLFLDMHNYLNTFSKNTDLITDKTVAAWLFIKKNSKQHPFLAQSVTKTFSQLVTEADDLLSVFQNINDNDIKLQFLTKLQGMKEWNRYYVTLFPVYLNRFIIDRLLENGYTDDVKQLIKGVFSRFKDYRNPFLWVVKNVEHLDEFGVEPKEIIADLIHILDLTYREIDAKQDVSNNRKYNKAAETLLFKDGLLDNYLEHCHLDEIPRMMDLIADARGFDEDMVEHAKAKISKRFPDFVFTADENKTITAQSISNRLIVSPAMYQAKQREFKYIRDVEIPKNAKEIGAAIAMGDLKENAEYKAGKEKQTQLNAAITRLQQELDRAQVFQFESIDTQYISFANVVTLRNNKTQSKEVFTILGPWESDPDRQIISYLSPLGKQLLGAEVGNHLKFTINERSYDYTVERIEAAEEPVCVEDEEKIPVELE